MKYSNKNISPCWNAETQNKHEIVSVWSNEIFLKKGTWPIFPMEMIKANSHIMLKYDRKAYQTKRAL